MRRAWRTVFASVVVALVVLAGCDAVPDIRFEGDAGSIDSSAIDSSRPPTDGGTSDASDAAAQDGSCSLLEAGDTCCGAIVCRGNCDPSNCSSCIGSCGLSDLCCAKNNNVICKPSSSPSCN